MASTTMQRSSLPLTRCSATGPVAVPAYYRPAPSPLSRPQAGATPSSRRRPCAQLSRPHPRCYAQPSEQQQQQQLPEGLKLEVDDGSLKDIHYDEETKTVKVPLSKLQSEHGQRRTKLVVFTCNKCGGRTSRAVNPIAWEKGLVFGQCSKCQVWHVLASNNPDIYQEVRYKDEENSDDGVAAARKAQ